MVKLHLGSDDVKKIFVFIFLMMVILVCTSCETEPNDDEENIVTYDNHYDGYVDTYPNAVIAEVYLKYNEFYSGYYLFEGNLYLCVTDLSVEDLVEYESNNTIFVEVAFSYNELYSVYTIMGNNMEKYGINTVSLDMSENSVIIYMSEEQETDPQLNHYEEIGLIIIIKSDGVNGW